MPRTEVLLLFELCYCGSFRSHGYVCKLPQHFRTYDVLTFLELGKVFTRRTFLGTISNFIFRANIMIHLQSF